MPGRAVTAADLAAQLATLAGRGRTLVVGVTGSVAAGKSTLSGQIVEALPADLKVESIATDGFLLPNARLTELGLLMRKGYPESYDADALLAAIDAVRQGPVRFPGYSHMNYDIDPALERVIDRPDILILEGLGLSPFPDGRSAAQRLDLLIYLDAEEADLETWFVRRFLEFWRAAENEPASFYAQFRTMTEAQVDGFARQVWAGINLPNLREHIVRARSDAHLVLKKALDHSLIQLRP
jgi:type I pantothenate kinase